MESSRRVGNRYETHHDRVTLFSTVAWFVCSRNSIRSNKSRNACDDTVQGLKNGMTMQQVAQVLYGKSYQQHLKKRNGSTVLKLPINFEGDEEGHKQLIHVLPDSATTHLRLNWSYNS